MTVVVVGGVGGGEEERGKGRRKWEILMGLIVMCPI